MGACGSTRCRCCTWPGRATQSPAAENDHDAPPPADTSFLFPCSGIVTERLEVVRRQRSQQRSPPCSVVIDVRLHREEESIQSPPGREDGEAIDRRWSNGSYKIRQQRGQFDRQREVDRVRRRCYGAVGARN